MVDTDSKKNKSKNIKKLRKKRIIEIKEIMKQVKKKYSKEPQEKPDNPMPWIEKYRAHSLDKIVGQTNAIKVIKESIKEGNMPHLLLYGPPGTGKTSTALALVRELFGPKILTERVKEMNASDDRGINTVRRNIEGFAKQTIGGSDPDYPCPPIKIIILDEFDAMTSDAQNALRVIMEKYSKKTRFILICNYINLVNDPIISRCAKFYFAPLSTKNSLKRIQFIANKENLNLSEEICKQVITDTEGDLRRAIMLLQNIKYYQQINGPVTSDSLDELRGTIPLRKIKKKIKKINDYSKAEKFAKKIICLGYSAHNIIDSLGLSVLQSDEFDEKNKSVIFFAIADAEKKLLDGADEYVQLMIVLMTIYKNKK